MQQISITPRALRVERTPVIFHSLNYELPCPLKFGLPARDMSGGDEAWVARFIVNAFMIRGLGRHEGNSPAVRPSLSAQLPMS